MQDVGSSKSEHPRNRHEYPRVHLRNATRGDRPVALARVSAVAFKIGELVHRINSAVQQNVEDDIQAGKLPGGSWREVEVVVDCPKKHNNERGVIHDSYHLNVVLHQLNKGLRPLSLVLRKIFFGRSGDQPNGANVADKDE